jgi:hypothetical protein
MIGKLTDISKSLRGKLRVTFEVDSIDELNGMEDKELTIKVTRKANKRSLNANAYFHVLVGKIADKLTISKAKAKNILMGRYGQREMENDKPLIISVVSECDLYEREVIHCIPVGYGHVNGREFTHWAVIKPSHTYDTVEMSKLIDGTVEEAKELGIETLTPAELERMMNTWSQSYKKNASVTYAEPQSDWSAIM